MAKDMQEMLKGVKSADSIKQDFVNKHINSKNEQNRLMAETFKKQLDNDTSVMLETSDKTGRRIGKDGKVYGPAMKKEDSGLYEKEVPSEIADKLQTQKNEKAYQNYENNRSLGMKKGGAVKKMAKGGSASSRADGCCTKGKTRGKMM
jgi:choline kinase